MSQAKDYYDRTYGMSFGMFCNLATDCRIPCVVETRNDIQEGTALDWIWTTPAKAIVGNDLVAKLVKDLGLN